MDNVPNVLSPSPQPSDVTPQEKSPVSESAGSTPSEKSSGKFIRFLKRILPFFIVVGGMVGSYMFLNGTSADTVVVRPKNVNEMRTQSPPEPRPEVEIEASASTHITNLSSHAAEVIQIIHQQINGNE